MKIFAPKGTKDILPSETPLWRSVESGLGNAARLFGYEEIRFPAFEHTELFQRSSGGGSDIVRKEMYTFTSKGGDSFSLRPEGTASVVRAFIENGLYAAAMPFKCYYIEPNFRYERPQKGRLRQHHQFGAELFGSADPLADAEVIGLAHFTLNALKIDDVVLHINSIGCRECRPVYVERLREFYEHVRDELCDDCRDRLTHNPLRILDCKNEKCRAFPNVPKPSDHLCNDCKAHHESLLSLLDENGIKYKRNDTLVRGLDYYTGTVFEFKTDAIGAQDTVCAGGRYDRLVESLGGPETPAAGFGIGIERLLLVLEAKNILPEKEKTAPWIYIASAEQSARANTAQLAGEIRKTGVRAEIDLCGRSLKAQMKHADKLNAPYSVVIGGCEIEEKTAAVKNMATGESITVPLCAGDIKRLIL